MFTDKLLPSKKVTTVDPIRDLATSISSIAKTASLKDENIANIVLSTESINSSNVELLTNVANNMKATIENIVQNFGDGIAFEDHQIEAATIAGMMGTDAKKVLNTPLRPIQGADQSIVAGVVDGSMSRQIATEAYDERENRGAQTYSILYNLLASRQDEFGESFFPTIVINPTEVGVLISVKLFYVYNDFKRGVKGALADYGRVNVIRAYADKSVLENELTKAIPVLRDTGNPANPDDNTAVFVSLADVPAWDEAITGNRVINTAALKVDNRIDLISLGQTDELLNSGIMGPSDNLDAYVKLKYLFLKAGTDVVRLDVNNIPGAVFTYAPQGNSRRMLLDMDTDSVVLNEHTVLVNAANPGDAFQTLTSLNNGAQIRLQVAISGSVVLDKGDTIVNRGSVRLVIARDANGDLIDNATIAPELVGAEIIGYTLSAYRANSNIRQRGQLLDTQTEFRVVQVPYRSPISVIAPTMIVNQEDTSAVQSLITTVGIRVSNEAVTALERAQNELKAYSSVALPNGCLPEMSMIGSYYIKPFYMEDELDLEVNVDSLKSHERLKDIRAAIVEKIRYWATIMHYETEYKAASDVLTGNVGFKPTVVVGCDPVIEKYLQSDGDFRTLGDKFDVRVVSSLDSRVAGKVFITFGVFDGNRNTAINPLNSGNMLYASEIVSNLPISRDGQVSHELIVTPRFYHMWNLPAMTVLNVKHLEEVTGKVAVNHHLVP